MHQDEGNRRRIDDVVMVAAGIGVEGQFGSFGCHFDSTVMGWAKKG
jgi:hypothetical protein